MYENQSINIKTLLGRFVFVAILFLISLLVRHLLLANYVTLGAAPPLAAEVSSSLASSSSTNTLPTPNKDFKIVASKYFVNNEWVVVAIKSPGTDTASEVLEKINGVYAVVLGPGTEFSSDDITEMPAEVSAYLISQGLVQ